MLLQTTSEACNGYCHTWQKPPELRSKQRGQKAIHSQVIDFGLNNATKNEEKTVKATFMVVV